VHDRSFMVVNADDGTFLSQRRTPAMAVIRATVRADGTGLVLAAPNADEAEIDVSFDGDRRQVSMFGKWFGIGVEQVEGHPSDPDLLEGYQWFSDGTPDAFKKADEVARNGVLGINFGQR